MEMYTHAEQVRNDRHSDNYIFLQKYRVHSESIHKITKVIAKKKDLEEVKVLLDELAFYAKEASDCLDKYLKGLGKY